MVLPTASVVRVRAARDATTQRVRKEEFARANVQRSVTGASCCHPSSRPVHTARQRHSPVVLRRFYQEQRAHDAHTQALEAAGERAERRQAAGIQARERQAAAVEEVLRSDRYHDPASSSRVALQTSAGF